MPNSIIDAEINQRLIPNHVGGILDLKIDTRGTYRKASDNNSDGSSRDVVRFSGLAKWQKDWVVGNGIVAGICISSYLKFLVECIKIHPQQATRY